MRSGFSNKKIDKKDTISLFKIAHANVLAEQQLLWQSSQLFLVANSFLVGFIGTSLTNSLKNNKFGILLLSIIGIIISILWLLSYTRILNYYKFRIAQAKQREPKDWMIFNGDGEAFSKGESIMINGGRYTFGIGKLSNLIIVRILVGLFIVFYLIAFSINILGMQNNF